MHASGPAVCGPRTRPARRAGPLPGPTSPGQQFPAIPPGAAPARSVHRSRPRTPAPAPHRRRLARFPHQPRPWAARQAVPSSPGSSTAVAAHRQPPARPRVRRHPGTTPRPPWPRPAQATFRVRSRVPRLDRRLRPGHQPALRQHRAGPRPHPASPRPHPASPRPHPPSRRPPTRCPPGRARRCRAARTFPVWSTARQPWRRPSRPGPRPVPRPGQPPRWLRQATPPRHQACPRQATPPRHQAGRRPAAPPRAPAPVPR